MTEQPNDRVDDCLIALRRILRATTLFERDLAVAAGITPAQLRVLQILYSGPGGRRTPTVLASQIGVAQATVTAIIDKLVVAKLVTRQRSETDRRQTHVIITPEGRSVVEDVPDALQQRFVLSFDEMKDWEQAQLMASLERVARYAGCQGYRCIAGLVIW